MRYRILTLTACSELAGKRRELKLDWLKEVNKKSQWSGSGEDISYGLICEAAKKTKYLTEKCLNKSYITETEGKAATYLFEALESLEVSVEVLDDPGFWRYLSIAYFWEFIAWRYKKLFGNGNHMKFMKYLDCQKSNKSVLTRMYLRMVAIDGHHHSELAYAADQAADLWNIHIIDRTKLGTCPPMAQAFVRTYGEQQLNDTQLREFAVLVNRKLSNIVPYIYNDDDAYKLISEIRDSMVISIQAD